jgi:hypothetical protein
MRRSSGDRRRHRATRPTIIAVAPPWLTSDRPADRLLVGTRRDRYWADLGFYFEYGFSTQDHASDTITFGPLIQKDIGRTTQTLNLFLSKNIGPNSDVHGYNFSYAWQSRWNVWRQASPAIEVYGDAGQIDKIGKLQDQQLLVGPVAVGTLLAGPLAKFKYEAGYLFGATRATADGTVRWKLELEVPL